ncbi:MAG: hypothetical protein F4018_03180 [Acidobacteria bacterium]|nr:hypothetical protein [Acidobacteriota bacterium]
MGVRLAAVARRRRAAGGEPVEGLLQRTVLLQLLDRTVEHEAAAVDQEHAIRNRVGLVQDVRRDQQRLGSPQPLDVLPELADLVRIEPRGRLVHDEHVRIVQQRLRHADALAVPPRQLADGLAGHQLEGAQVDDRVHPLLQERGSHPSRLPEKAQQLERRHVGVHRAVLGQVAETSGRGDPIPPDVVPRDGRLARTRRQVPGQHPHHRGLPGAVRPEEGDDLTLGDGERNVVNRDEGSVVLGEPRRLDHHRHWLGSHGLFSPTG